MSIPIAARPPSPPHSIDGDLNQLREVKHAEGSREPFTPPRTIMPANFEDNSFDVYGDPSLYQTAPSQVYYSPQPTFVRTMPYHTPPTAPSDPGVHTRSGRALGSPLRQSHLDSMRRSRSPRRRRAPKAKTGKRGSPLIDQPLSALTKDYIIPIRDMGAWVTRSVEDRMKEVDKKKGHISRPMNSFMLYRSAFAERVKKFCKENNHQVVSQVTGASWPLEPSNVREQYETYARVERDNHQAAHPDYKFTPNKSGKKQTPVDDDDDASGDDPDWEGSTRSTKRVRNARHEEMRSQSSTPFDGDMVRYPTLQYQQVPLHPSSYQYSNPHGPAPVMLGPNGMVGQYYQTSIAPISQDVDDIRYIRMDDPFHTYDGTMPLVGMPGTGHHNLLNPTGMGFPQPAVGASMLDPRLSQVDANYQYQHFDGDEQTYDVPANYAYGSYSVQQEQEVAYSTEAFHPGLATLTDGQNNWPEASHVGSDFDSEFNNWT